MKNIKYYHPLTDALLFCSTYMYMSFIMFNMCVYIET